MHMAVSILRLKDGLDYSSYLSEEEEYTNGHIHPVGTVTTLNTRQHSQEFIPRNESFIQMSAGKYKQSTGDVGKNAFGDCWKCR